MGGQTFPEPQVRSCTAYRLVCPYQMVAEHRHQVNVERDVIAQLQGKFQQAELDVLNLQESHEKKVH